LENQGKIAGFWRLTQSLRPKLSKLRSSNGFCESHGELVKSFTK
jgi:hypothetical protein